MGRSDSEIEVGLMLVKSLERKNFLSRSPSPPFWQNKIIGTFTSDLPFPAWEFPFAQSSSQGPLIMAQKRKASSQGASNSKRFQKETILDTSGMFHL
jgi:hypothetical protein